jgi:hypothetical protein
MRVSEVMTPEVLTVRPEMSTTRDAPVGQGPAR